MTENKVLALASACKTNENITPEKEEKSIKTQSGKSGEMREKALQSAIDEVEAKKAQKEIFQKIIKGGIE